MSDTGTHDYFRDTQDWYFTFGSAHRHPDGYVVIHGTVASARAEMHRRYGPKWAGQYESAEAAGVDKFGLSRVEDEGGA